MLKLPICRVGAKSKTRRDIREVKGNYSVLRTAKEGRGKIKN